MLALYPGLLVLAGLALLGWRLLRPSPQSRTLATMPGPPAWPLLGNILQVDVAAGNPYRQFMAWGQLYGPVFRLRLGPRHSLVVASSYEAVQEVLVTRGKAFSGRLASYASTVFSDDCGIVSADGNSPKLRIMRRMTTQAANAFSIGKSRVEELAMEMTHDFIGSFHSSEGAPVNPRKDIQTATLHMLSLLVFGEKFQVDSAEYRTVAEVMQLVNSSVENGQAAMMLDAFPWLRYFGNKVYKDMKRARQLSMDFWSTILRRGMYEEGDCLLRAMFHHNQTAGGEETRLCDADMRTLGFQLQMAGMLTTSNSMMALLLVLLHHPEIQAAMHKEVEAVVGARAVRLQDEEALPYTQAVLLELLRYSSVSPLSMPHKALEDTSLGGHPVPKDTIVLANFYAVHMDPHFWHNPQAFHPERFLDDRGQLLPHDHPNRKHFIAFGGGPRGCLGESLAKVRMFLWTVTLLQQFELKPDESEPLVPCDPQYYKSGLVCSPPDFKVRFIPR